MTTVADLPNTVKFEPAPWEWGMDSAVREQTLMWSVPFADFATFYQKVLFTVETVIVVPAVPGPLVTIDRVSPLVCPMDPTLVALNIRPWKEPQILGEGQSHAGGPWEETSTGSGVYRPRTSHPSWITVYPAVTFGIPSYPPAGANAFLSVSEDRNTERVSIPNHPYWLYDTNPAVAVEWVAHDLSISRGTSAFNVTWHEVPGAHIAAAQAILDSIMDKVNSDTVTIPILGNVCPPGTLKGISKSSSAEATHGNNIKANISIRLARIPGGWNRFVASVSGYAGQLLRANSAGGPPFPETPFSVVFNPTV